MRKLLELAILAAVVASLMGPGPLLAGDYKITHLDKNRVYPGKTLLADMSDRRRARVVEVDFDGNVLWEWEPPGRGAVLDATYLKNGNILITVVPVGIFEVNRSGKTVWQHLDREASHDADRLANGNTLYNLGWQDKGQDVVREINPGGELVWSWTGIADYNREPFADINSEGWMHVNSVTRLDNGNTLVSIRNFNTVAEVGPDGRVVRDWTFHGKDKRTGVQTRGKIKGERNHEPEVLPNGNMMIQGPQEVRTNGAVRQLSVAGIIRPEDITSSNTIRHSQIAEARISYGGRGDISRVQRTPAGQALVETFSPF